VRGRGAEPVRIAIEGLGRAPRGAARAGCAGARDPARSVRGRRL